MNNLTPRAFLYSSAGPTLGSGMSGHASLLHASFRGIPVTTVDAQNQSPLQIMPLSAYAVLGSGQFPVNESFGIAFESHMESRLARVCQLFLTSSRPKRAFHCHGKLSSTSQSSSLRLQRRVTQFNIGKRMSRTTSNVATASAEPAGGAARPASFPAVGESDPTRLQRSRSHHR